MWLPTILTFKNCIYFCACMCVLGYRIMALMSRCNGPCREVSFPGVGACCLSVGPPSLFLLLCCVLLESWPMSLWAILLPLPLLSPQDFCDYRVTSPHPACYKGFWGLKSGCQAFETRKFTCGATSLYVFKHSYLKNAKGIFL